MKKKIFSSILGLGLSLSISFAVALSVGQPVRAQTVNTFTAIWATPGCEARPGGPFARREMIIEGPKFQQKLTVYRDAGCIIPILRLRTEGQFVVRNASLLAPGAGEVEFIWRKAYLTALTNNAADNLNLNQAGLCGTLPFSAGAEQDLEVTRGCRPLSIDMRRTVVEYDVAVISGGQLFFGARPIDGGYPNSPERRAVSFGPPLVKVRDIVLDTVPLTPILNPLLPETSADLAAPATWRAKPR
jgi:Adenomatosis polyposis coli down-regulated 1